MTIALLKIDAPLVPLPASGEEDEDVYPPQRLAMPVQNCRRILRRQVSSSVRGW
ncbi:hypothetical protein [Microcoleus sp. FACHB-68]|uniref:hypothetical protein n=1 Tax=Microcoleus sp. FACHB-68 TaxID=2692826 RepID=UPI001684BC51|nr:hypothetical protein [Microcoleus sp. FACHB-68]MBD1938515.1 hypothetical protein [Microcoleus sp. FACHB-68]